MDVSQAIEAPISLYSTSYTTSATPFSTPSSHFHPRPPPPSPASPDSATTRYCDNKSSMASTRQTNYRTPPSYALRQFNPNYSGDEASEDDGDDSDVPPTPGDIAAFQPITLVPYSRGGGGVNARGGVELSKLFGNGIGSNTATIQDDGSLSLSPVANVFYPSFGDFLPAVKKQKEVLDGNALGLSGWGEPIEEEKSSSQRIESLSNSLSTRIALQDNVEEVKSGDEKPTRIASPVTGQSIFAPFASFSPNTDSFAFFPSLDWKASNREVEPMKTTKETTLTSSSLLSPVPNLSLPTFPMQRSLSSSHVEPSRSHVILTPPSTPTRNTSFHTAPSMQPSRSLPIPTAFSPTRSQFAAPSPTRMSFTQSPSHVVGGGYPPSPYPLSPADTERIAKLHNGRIPTLEQLCPEPAHPSAQPPIVNTGNQGVMVVQQGDWKCGTCSFVNWRRRKICLRCFPFANDIGNILTIQSQRAAHLAGPPPPLSAPAHQTNFLLPSPTRGHFDPSLSASSGMARSSSYPPDSLSQRRSSSPYTQAYLAVPPPQQPQSASPTRSTFALHHHQQPPASPTRYMHSPLSTPPKSNMPAYLYPEEDRSFTPLSSTSSGSSSFSASSAGELALRRSAKLHQLSPSAHKYKSLQIQPLNLQTGRANYVQPQYSPTFQRSPSYYQPPRESPPSPTRYLNHRSGGDELTRMLGAEL